MVWAWTSSSSPIRRVKVMPKLDSRARRAFKTKERDFAPPFPPPLGWYRVQINSLAPDFGLTSTSTEENRPPRSPTQGLASSRSGVESQSGPTVLAFRPRLRIERQWRSESRHPVEVSDSLKGVYLRSASSSTGVSVRQGLHYVTRTHPSNPPVAPRIIVAPEAKTFADDASARNDMDVVCSSSCCCSLGRSVCW